MENKQNIYKECNVEEYCGTLSVYVLEFRRRVATFLTEEQFKYLDNLGAADCPYDYEFMYMDDFQNVNITSEQIQKIGYPFGKIYSK